ncbi:MAG TPA: indolepyruvate ferredoxin oxidoreductase family protein [Burkholderiaceae bacterium]
MAIADVNLNDKYTLASGRIYVTGLQALTRLLVMQRERDQAAGKNTAGFVSGYQGSPLNNMDKTLAQARPLLERNHIHFQPGQNEELAAIAVWGSQQVTLDPSARYDGVFGMWFGKWAGVGRCGDAFNHGNSAGASAWGGVLLVCGDDHMARSSTVATQSEHMVMAPMIPVLSPASVQDYLDLGIHGWAMSRYSGSWVALKALDETIEGSASVSVDPHRVKVKLPEDFELPPGGLNLRLPDQPLAMERRIHEQRLPAVLAYVRANRLNWAPIDSENARLGIVTSGKSYLDVRQALDHLGIDHALAARLGIKVFKVGVTWPLEPRGIEDFAAGLDELLVVEEKRPLLEEQIKNQLYHWPESRRPRVLGKRDESDASGAWLFPPTGELTPEQIALVIAQRVARFTQHEGIERRVQWLKDKEEAARKTSLSPQLRGYLGDSGRVPFFCSGCPHNTSTRVPEGSTAIAGVGCHFMATYIFPGSEIFSPMGAEGAAWIGHAPFTDTRHIFANMGDGTYYHSGLLAIRSAVSARASITFKVLYNDATAATGGQALPHALSVPGLTRQLEAEGVERVVVVSDQPEKYDRDPGFAKGVQVRHRDQLNAVQKELREQRGVTAIIYDQTCAAEKRRRRKRGAFPDPQRRMFINTQVCEGCGDCSDKSNCVSVQPVETEFGRKRAIDQSACNKDFSCAKGLCPSFVSVLGGQPRRLEAQAVSDEVFARLPAPTLPASTRPYGIVVAGAGGTGIITVGALLGMAAHLEGKGVSVLDMTGVAQKGGAVTTYVRIADDPESLHAVRIAAGDANALIGCDILVSAENSILTRVQRDVTRAVINTHRMATVAFIKNRDLHTPWDEIEQGLRDAIGAQTAHFLDASRITTALTGDSLATNMLLLGCAFQLGMVPLSEQAILRAIEINGVAVDANKRAFRWGRMAIHDPAEVEQRVRATGVADSTEGARATTLDERIARRVEFLTRYQNAAYARRYASLVQRVRDAESKLPAATRADERLSDAVARSYFKLLAVKDEYEVARLYTNGEFGAQVRNAFEGDYKLRYHFAPPLWVKPDPNTGVLKKRTYGQWITPLLHVLARLRRLRGSPLDVFGYSAERRLERSLVVEFERLTDEIIGALAPEKHELAVKLAQVPDAIRGYGQVKLKSIDAAQAQTAVLLARFRGTAPQQPVHGPARRELAIESG